MEWANLNNDVVNILGICYSYNKKLENENNFLNHVIKLQNVLNMWKMRNLSLLCKISIFKTFAFSIIHLTLVTFVLSSTIDLLNKIQKDFLWDEINAKIRLTTLQCENRWSISKNGETNKSILSLNNVFDLKKKVLFNLNVLKKPFGWVALSLSIFLFVFYIGEKEFIVFFVE